MHSCTTQHVLHHDDALLRHHVRVLQQRQGISTGLAMCVCVVRMSGIYSRLFLSKSLRCETPTPHSMCCLSLFAP